MEGKDVIGLMRSHTSVRDYTDEPVSEEDYSLILEAARAASSSCFLQLTTIIRVTNKSLREKLAVLAGNQAQVASAPEFWVFCADFRRCDSLIGGTADLGYAEQLIVGCTDIAIMAQSAMTALEALGLGGCFIGGIRNGMEEVDNLLGLPQNVIPVLGLAFGHPRFRNEVKPRLPAGLFVFENRYQDDTDEEIESYNEELRSYYLTRQRGAKDDDWRGAVRAVLSKERRPFVLDFLKKKGFALK